MAEEPIVMSAEQLWGAADEEIEKYRGEDHEITDFDHKVAKDMRDFANSLNKNPRKFDNIVHIYGNGRREGDSDEYDEDNFFDNVPVTYINK
ncbi:hypothetical protein TRFO_07387 [Tritrichomonas foetus]|uniref:Uncharacterized protein n=1 Tax=Tritrichomonas foetus TaxID=1144522 RepID=A0A1J4JRR3_9EUKA|nr:hypothetical protein TRFO_07387 [Tritrichomonas foetus]|eukprot:OHT01823.1 hypothetical protein TRFO_07387 [Tritrichomonas foetus]